jgi:hypothetical protein
MQSCFLHQGLVLRPSCVPEKASVNQNDVNKNISIEMQGERNITQPAKGR